MRHAQDPFATLNEDYRAAIIRLTWAVDRSTRARVLLCGGVELVPQEVPPPDARSERHLKLSRGYFLYAHEVVVSPTRGLAWFEDTETGKCIRIGTDGGLPESGDPNATMFAMAPLAPEPPRPAVVAPTIQVPFVANWHCTPRVRHLIATSPVPWKVTEDERARATVWLETELHVSLELLPEFWGSAHLIAPNPVFRSLRVRHEVDDRNRSSLVAAIVPRTARTLEGLQLVIEEERSAGLGVLASVPVTETVTRIELPTAPGSVRERVIDPVRGVLWDSSFGVFDVGFSLSVEMSTSVRMVAATREGEQGYSVALVGGLRNESRVDGRSPLPAATVLHKASIERNRRHRGATEQRWFRDREADAIKALREVIGKAKQEVLICDPYFGGDDVSRLVLAIADPQAHVRILTSAMHLRRERDDGKTEGEYLVERLEEALRAPSMNPTEVRVMIGRESAIHDRFLWLGNRLWMLGSSINRFGGRGTLMVVVPDHEPVIGDLEHVWTESPTLATWIAEHPRNVS